MMIGIAGASGLIGSNLYKTLKNSGQGVIGTYFSSKKSGLVKFDLGKDSFSLFDKCRQVVIAAAITSIDECFLRKEQAYRLNVEKTKELLLYLADRKIKPVFLSSDQVFDGRKGNYTEDDASGPLNYYGDFKLQVEEFIKENLGDYLIFRLSKTFSKDIEDPGMFSQVYLGLKNGQRIKAARNQIFNPTDVVLACTSMQKAMENDTRGLFHLASPGIMSRYDFALSVAREYGFKEEMVEPVDIGELKLIEKRPLNSSLSVKKFARLFAG